MKAIHKSFLIILIIGLNISGQVYEYDIYENLHIASTSAGSAIFNNSVMDFLPFNINELSTLKKFTIAGSFNYNKGGVKFGSISNEGTVRPERTTLENIDLVKNALFVYAIRPDFLPFISYYTPFKYNADNDLKKEIVKRQDVISVGVLSTVGKNSIGISIDYNWSDHQIITSKQTIQERAWGISNRLVINLQTAKNTSFSAGVVTPVYFINKLDKQQNQFVYFNKTIYNAALNYDDKQFFGSYGATYREFDTFVDNKGDYINYSWLIEHKLTSGYYINNGVRFLMDYQLQPSVYLKPVSLKTYRHSIGAGLLYRYNNSYWNFYGSDSRLFSDDVMDRTYFQLDIGYTF